MAKKKRQAKPKRLVAWIVNLGDSRYYTCLSRTNKQPGILGHRLDFNSLISWSAHQQISDRCARLIIPKTLPVGYGVRVSALDKPIKLERVKA